MLFVDQLSNYRYNVDFNGEIIVVDISKVVIDRID